jgi:lipoprotein-releasing system ATP-binding protein
MTAAEISHGDELLRVEGVTRVLPAVVPVTLVKDIDLVFRRGEFASITGPSGSGKSSLLYLLGLLDVPTAGRVLIEGADTAEMSRDEKARLRLETIGFVFQFHFLLPEFSVIGNVMIPMRRLGRLSGPKMRERAAGILTGLGLADHMEKLPEQLSGGQRQRVAVARALANDPPLVLADEPTGSLDSKSSDQVIDILEDLVREGGKTVIAVTHDPDVSGRTERRVHLVDGEVVQDEVVAPRGATTADS